MNKLLIINILLNVLFCWNSDGQDTISDKPEIVRKYIKYLDFRVENGAMLGNSNEIGDQLVNSSYYNGIDIRLGFRKTNPNDIYSNVYRRPYMGVGFYASTFHNADVGKPNALYYFLTIPFVFEQDKRFTFDYSMAFGLSYQFNPYDSINNPTNIFIGSYRNCYVHLGVAGNYKINDRWQASATLGFKHFSNGSFKKPNYGINLVPLTLGVSYKFSNQKIEHLTKPIPTFQKYNIWNLMVAFGSKNYEHGEPNYLKMTYGVNYLRAINYKYRFGLGLDMFYSARPELRTESGKADFSDAVSFAIVPNWEWVLSKKLYVPLGIGFYLSYNPENDEKTWFYERAGIRYKFTEHIAAGVTIKAHKGSADFFEWTLVYSFQNDKNEY
jgi:Lipid A 3-O-deacylase (PagL)